MSADNATAVKHRGGGGVLRRMMRVVGRKMESRAPRRKSGARQLVGGSCESAPQVVLGGRVAARKLWAGQTENGLHTRRSRTPQQKLFGDPEVCDAPIRIGEALRNPQTVQPRLIDGGGLGSSEALPHGIVRRSIHAPSSAHTYRRENGIRRGKPFRTRGGLQQGTAVGGKSKLGMLDFHPRGAATRQAPLRLLIGEPCQSSQMAPIGAGQVSLIQVSQLFADGGGHRRGQRLCAHLNPALETARAGLDHHAGFMAMEAHGIEDRGPNMVQIHQNVAGVLRKAIGLEVHVKSVAVASAEKSDHRFAGHLGRRPKPLAWEGSAGVVVNQSDEIPAAGHGRQLAAHGMPREPESAIPRGRWLHGGPMSCLTAAQCDGQRMDPRPRLRSWLRSKSARYRETLQATGRTTRIFNRPKRVCADALEANSVASAWIPPGSVLPWRPSQTNTTSATSHGKQDISTLQRIGHFYFALTGGSFFLTCPLRCIRFSSESQRNRQPGCWARARCAAAWFGRGGIGLA